MKEYNLTVIIQKDEDGNFIAKCPTLQGCYTDGETIKEALEMIKDVIKLHIEDRLDKHEPIHEEVYSSKMKITI